MAIEYIKDGEHKSKIVKGFRNIAYLYPNKHPNRLSVLYSENRDWIPEDAEWVGDQPEGSEKAYELIFHSANIKEVVFEEEWDYEVSPTGE